MVSMGVRELKNNLSQCIRRVEAGERVSVTAHGRTVALLVPPATAASGSKRERLIAEGLLRPATARGPLRLKWPKWALPAGTVKELIDFERGE
jgi:prevent-host-death family protein